MNNVVKVTFFGSKDSLSSWKKIVAKVTMKKCERILKMDDISYKFSAHINEEDCVKLMDYWYEKEDGSDVPWNWRVSFKKTTAARPF